MAQISNPSSDSEVGYMAQHQACQGCPIRSILDCTEVAGLRFRPALIRVARGQSVAEIGMPPRHLVAVVDGLFRLQKCLSDGRRLITGFRFAGEILPRLDPKVPWDVAVEAVVPSSVCQVDAEAFAAMRAVQPQIDRKVLALVWQDITAANERMILLGLKTPLEKVATFLLEIRGRLCRDKATSRTVPIDMPREDIGDYLGLSPETVSRSLSKLVSEGTIVIQRPSRINLCKLSRLTTLAGGGHPRGHNGEMRRSAASPPT